MPRALIDVAAQRSFGMNIETQIHIKFVLFPCAIAEEFIEHSQHDPFHALIVPAKGISKRLGYCQRLDRVTVVEARISIVTLYMYVPFDSIA